MQKLEVIFPYISAIFSSEGISQSEAQRKKEQNKNTIDSKKSILDYDSTKVYKTLRTVISDTNTREDNAIFNEPYKVEDFNLLGEFAKLNSVSAILGNAIKRKEDIIKAINSLSFDDISIYFNIEKPSFNVAQPRKKSLQGISIDRYCELDKVEELFQYANIDLFNLIKEYYNKGLEVEAQASVYGKYVVNSDSILRTIVKSKDIANKKTTNATNFIIETYDKLNINLGEFKELEEKLMETYTEYQKQRNSIVKNIKDKARELESRYNTEYLQELSEYNKKKLEYSNKCSEYEARLNSIRNELLQEASSLKIKE